MLGTLGQRHINIKSNRITIEVLRLLLFACLGVTGGRLDEVIGTSLYPRNIHTIAVI